MRALGEIDAIQALKGQDSISLLDADLFGLELVQFVQCFIIFGFAAAALEASILSGFLKTFGKNETD